MLHFLIQINIYFIPIRFTGEMKRNNFNEY